MQPLLLRPIGKTIGHIINRDSQIKRNLLKLKLPGLYLGKIKNFIYYTLERIGLRINGMKNILLIIIKVGLHGQFRHADDTV